MKDELISRTDIIQELYLLQQRIIENKGFFEAISFKI